MVNDRYWLQRARTILDQSIRGRDEAAARLASGIGWLWTVYTGAALVGVALTGRPLSIVTVALIALPVASLVAAYGLAVWAGLPLDVAFDPRVIEEIEEVHTNATREKQKRLRRAALAAAVSALTVIVAIAATAAVREGPPNPSLTATVQHQEDGEVAVLIQGQFPHDQPVTLTAASSPAGGTTLASILVVANATGVLRVTLPVPGSDNYYIRAEWTQDRYDWSLTTRAAGTK